MAVLPVPFRMSLEIGLILNEMLPVGSYIDGPAALSLGNTQKSFMSHLNTIFASNFGAHRGSIPCPWTLDYQVWGHTTCFEITCGAKRIIIDAGTGIRLLGKQIMLNEGNLLDADLFFTHTHMDHIQGLPFLLPLYNPNSNVRLNAGHLDGDTYDLQGIIGTMLMKDPVFPVPSALIEKACVFSDFTCGKIL